MSWTDLWTKEVKVYVKCLVKKLSKLQDLILRTYCSILREMNKRVFISALFASIVPTSLPQMSGIMLRASTFPTHFNTNALSAHISAPVISHY